MKPASILFSLSLAFSASAFFTGCSGGKKDTEDVQDKQESQINRDENPTADEPQHRVDDAFRKQLASVFTSYLSLKEALVSSSAVQAKAQASSTTKALSDVDMGLLSGAAHHDWMNFLAPMQKSLKEIASSGDIEIQRRAFSTLSDNLYKSIKAFGLGGKEAFYDYCPMAFDDEGAYWLSDEKEIKNPYFGDKMLTCGEVKETLR